jgi:hypothetical protein
MRSVERFARDPQVPLGLQGLNDTVQVLAPTIDNLAGVQTRCNYIALLLNNAANILADHDSSPQPQGSWVRLLAIPGPIGVNSEGGPSAAPADGPIDFPEIEARNPQNHLHANVYPSVGAPGQANGCMAGNELYARGTTVIGNPPGAPSTTARVDEGFPRPQ